MKKQYSELADLGAGWVEAYLYENDVFQWMAIQEGTPEIRVVMYEFAARGICHVPADEREQLASTREDTDFVFLIPRNHTECNGLIVRGLIENMQEMDEGWTRRVEQASRLSGDPDEIAMWSGLPFEVVLAVLECLGLGER